MLNDVRVYPTGSGGPFAISERRTPPPSPPRPQRKGREHFAYRNAIPLLFKGEDRFRGLTPNEIAVLCSLLRRARHEFDGRCWPTHAQLVGDLHETVSARHVTRVVASLRDKGWLRVHTVHSNQQLPSGSPLRGGERNVYEVQLARILGLSDEAAGQDGPDVHPRDANDDGGAHQIADESAAAVADAVDQDLNKITDPQHERAPEECIDAATAVTSEEELAVAPGHDSAEVVACMVLAYWLQTTFPEYAEVEGRSVDLAAGPQGRARVARVLGLLQRGFEPETLRDAILGATLDDYARNAGCPLPLVFGEKILHYARLGARERAKHRRAAAREAAPTARTASEIEHRAPPPPRIHADQMLADISRIFRGGPAVPRRDYEPSLRT